MTITTKARISIITSLIILSFSFLVAKDAASRFELPELIALRIFASFTIMLLFFRPRELPDRRTLWIMFLSGAVLFTITQATFMYGIHLAAPIDGALLFTFIPILTLIGAHFWLNEKLTLRRTMGAVIAACGVLIVLQTRGFQFDSTFLLGDMLLLVCIICIAAQTLLNRALLIRHGPGVVLFWTLAFGSLAVSPYVLYMLPSLDWSRPGWSGWLEFLFLVVSSNILVIYLANFGLKHLETAQATIFLNLQPVFTAIFAYLLFKELPDISLALGGALVMLGVSLSQLSYSRRN